MRDACTCICTAARWPHAAGLCLTLLRDVVRRAWFGYVCEQWGLGWVSGVGAGREMTEERAGVVPSCRTQAGKMGAPTSGRRGARPSLPARPLAKRAAPAHSSASPVACPMPARPSCAAPAGIEAALVAALHICPCRQLSAAAAPCLDQLPAAAPSCLQQSQATGRQGLWGLHLSRDARVPRGEAPAAHAGAPPTAVHDSLIACHCMAATPALPPLFFRACRCSGYSGGRCSE